MNRFRIAAGRRAKANHNGTFVWADSTDADFASTGLNQFLIEASGEARVQLHSGDLLVITTDGVHEARDARGNEFGMKRLSRIIHLSGRHPV